MKPAPSAPPLRRVGASGASRLRREPGTPLHHQLYLILRDQIASGRFAAQATLPTEEELARQFGVSRATVRSAMAPLVDSGLVERRQGVGSVVAQGPVASMPMRAAMSDLLTHMQSVRENFEVKVLEFGYEPAPPRAREFFQAADDARFQRSVRVRYRGKVPVMHLVAWLPESIGRRFTRRDFERHALADLLAGQGIRLAGGTQTISATLATPASAHVLEVAIGSALISLQRFHYDSGGSPVEYLELLASPEHFHISLRFDGPEPAAKAKTKAPARTKAPAARAGR